MDSKKQKLLIEFLISSTDTFAVCQSIIKSEYFDPEFRQSIDFIKQYYDEYSATPSPKQLEAEAGQVYELCQIMPDEIKYCANEIEKFCKHSAMKRASNALPALIKEEKYAEAEDLIKDAVMVSLTNDLGLRYFEDVEGRLQRMLKENPTTSTGWADLDDALFGGISRKELTLLSANSGGGKSLALANMSYNFILQGYNVLYISLELSEDIIAQRFDTMFTGISRKVWKENVDEISTRITAAGQDDETGILDVIQLPSGTTSHQIRAYLKEFNLHYGMMPDFLVLDYLDNMSPNEYVSADNVFEKDKRSAEQLRQILVDYNMFGATASQLNRSAIGATSHDHSQIAGGISKINVADVYWSIIFTEQMRAMGKLMFILQKTRNSDGLGTQIHLKWDSKFLRFLDEDSGGDEPFKIKLKQKESDENKESIKSGDKLDDMLKSFAL